MLPRAERLKLMAAYETSGLTMAGFARREGINYTTFAGWMARAGRTPATRAPVKFAQVQMPAVKPALPKPSEPLEVRLPDGTVLRGSRVADLASLVRALRS